MTSDEEDWLADEVIVLASTLAGGEEEVFIGGGRVKLEEGNVRLSGGGPVKFALGRG